MAIGINLEIKQLTMDLSTLTISLKSRQYLRDTILEVISLNIELSNHIQQLAILEAQNNS